MQQHQQSSDLIEQLGALGKQAIDPFSRLALEGARRALIDSENPLRLNFFSAAMRILFEHMMGTLAPIDEVKKSQWFFPQREDGSPTRWQRVVFAIQGGLLDSVVVEELGVDIEPLRRRLLGAIDDLSKHVHAREDTIVRDVVDQDEAAKAAIEALSTMLQTYHECRSLILSPIQEALDQAAIDALLYETIQEIDELASHHSIGEIYVANTWVENIGSDGITYCAEGSLDITLQWGSNSDVRRGDGVEVGECFPFRCEIQVSLDDIWDLSGAETTYYIDRKGWGDRDPDDD
jgi:hypothetical protein